MVATTRPFRVLVVDDYPDTSATLALFLKGEGYDVRAANSGEHALALIESWEPHAAILDIKMPGMDGTELARRLCAGLTRRPVLIAVSGSIRPGYLEWLKEAGFDHEFLKPVDPHVLVQILKAHADGSVAR
jgi:CheY-like chemotaxis protein